MEKLHEFQINYLGQDKMVSLIPGADSPMYKTINDRVIFELPVSNDYPLTYHQAEMICAIAQRATFNDGTSSKIQAIKMLRAFSTLGLKEAKEIVEYTLAHFRRVE
jgi:hypothetical protein